MSGNLMLVGDDPEGWIGGHENVVGAGRDLMRARREVDAEAGAGDVRCRWIDL